MKRFDSNVDIRKNMKKYPFDKPFADEIMLLGSEYAPAFLGRTLKGRAIYDYDMLCQIEASIQGVSVEEIALSFMNSDKYKYMLRQFKPEKRPIVLFDCLP